MKKYYLEKKIRNVHTSALKNAKLLALSTAILTANVFAKEPVFPPLTDSTNPATSKSNQQSKADDSITLKTITVIGKPTSSALEPVEGYVTDNSLTGSKTDTPIIEIPQSISVINRDEIAAHAAQNISEAISYTPGILTEMFGPSTRDDYFNIRGFDAPQYLDGTRLVGANYANLRIEPYGLERIEILRGPATVLYGQNPPGGLVNMMSKRPTDAPFHEVQMLGGSFNRIQGSLDLSGPIDDNGKYLYRLTALGRGSDTQVDYSEDNRYFVAPSFTWKPSDDTSFTFLSHYQKDETGNTMQFLPFEGTVLPNPNGRRIPTNRFLGEPDYDHYNREQYAVGYAFAHRFNETFSVRQNLRYADVSSDYPVIFPLGFVTDDDGVPIDYRTISRLAGLYQDDAGTFTLDNQLQSDFATGFLNHTFLAGVDYRHVSGNRNRGFSYPADIDVFDPVYRQPFDSPVMETLVNQDQDQTGFYGQDQIRLNNWIATIGVRKDWSSSDTIQTDVYNPETDSIDFNNPVLTTTRQSDQAFTYRTGLGYLFDKGFAPYFSYSESFEPVPGTDFAGTPFKPTTGQQYELGLKYQPHGYNAFITFSAFHLKEQNVVTADPDPEHVGYSIQTGEARSQGIELEGKASLALGLDATAGYSYTDTKVLKTNEADQLGKQLTYTPENQASLWLDYTQPTGEFAGLGMGSGIRYVDSNYGDLSNSQSVPSYVLYDAAVHYDFRKWDSRLQGMRLAVNMTNLLDKEYLVSCGEGSCFYGERRTVLASLRYNW